MERMAIDNLESLYLGLDAVEELDGLSQQTVQIVESIEEITQLFQSLDELFFSERPNQFWDLVSGLVLEVGDIDLLEALVALEAL